MRTPVHRAFERVLRVPKLKREEIESVSQRPPSRYEILASVTVENDFYNSDGDLCLDFSFRPTPTTAALLTRLGLLFRPEGTGFSVLFDCSRQEQLIDYLRRMEESGAQNGELVWPRLSFALSNNNPLFTSLTDIPISTDPTMENFYFSNRDAHRSTAENKILLNPGRRVRGEQLVKTIGTQYALPVSRRVDLVLVRNIEGTVVDCQPRCVPAAYARTVPQERISCDDLNSYLAKTQPVTDDQVCREIIHLNFSLLPEDEYTIEKMDAQGNPVEPPEKVLYTSTAPIPLCFIDLLFAKPTGPKAGKREGIYPVRNLTGKNPTIVTVDYTLKFQRRGTVWNYFVIGAENAPDLRIETTTGEPVGFFGPCLVKLSNGKVASRFTSMEPIPLMQRSDFHFQLVCGGNGSEERVLIRRLPVASPGQVLPLTRREFCQVLRKSLIPGPDAAPSCRRLVEKLCPLFEGRAGRTSVPPSLEASEFTTYSDLYVYV